MTRRRRTIALVVPAVMLGLIAWLSPPELIPAGTQPSSAATTRPRIVLLADPHVDKDDGYRFGLWKPNPAFDEAIASINALTPAPREAVILGDLGRAGREADYKKYLEKLSALKVRPVRHMLGNHDEFRPFEKVVLEGPKPVPPGAKAATRHYYAWDFDQHWRFIALDTRGGMLGGELGPKQIAWFEKQVKTAAEKNVLVLAHHDPTRPSSRGVKDAEEFLAILKRHRNVRAIFHGHLHEMSFGQHADRVHVVGAPTTSWIFKPRRARGYLLLTPLPSSLTVEFVPAAKRGNRRAFTKTLDWKD